MKTGPLCPPQSCRWGYPFAAYDLKGFKNHHANFPFSSFRDVALGFNNLPSTVKERRTPAARRTTSSGIDHMRLSTRLSFILIFSMTYP